MELLERNLESIRAEFETKTRELANIREHIKRTETRLHLHENERRLYYAREGTNITALRKD